MWSSSERKSTMKLKHPTIKLWRSTSDKWERRWSTLSWTKTWRENKKKSSWLISNSSKSLKNRDTLSERRLLTKISFTLMEKCKLKTQTKSNSRKRWRRRTNTTTFLSSLETSLKSIEPIWVHNWKMIFRVSWITKRRIHRLVPLLDSTLKSWLTMPLTMPPASKASTKQVATNPAIDLELLSNFLIPNT